MELNPKKAVLVAFGSVKTIEQLRTTFWLSDILGCSLSDEEISVAAKQAVERVRASAEHELACFQQKIEEANKT